MRVRSSGKLSSETKRRGFGSLAPILTRSLKPVSLALVVAGAILFFLNYQGLFAKGIGVNLIALHPDRTIYPFTYLGAGLSLFVPCYFIFKAERTKGKANFVYALAMGALVADVSSVGMLNVFEQVFVTFNQLACHFNYWFVAYWGTPDAALSTLIGLAFVFETMPWWNRLNLKLVFVSLSLFVGGIVAWYLIGSPQRRAALCHTVSTPSLASLLSWRSCFLYYHSRLSCPTD